MKVRYKNKHLMIISQILRRGGGSGDSVCYQFSIVPNLVGGRGVTEDWEKFPNFTTYFI